MVTVLKDGQGGKVCSGGEPRHCAWSWRASVTPMKVAEALSGPAIALAPTSASHAPLGMAILRRTRRVAKPFPYPEVRFDPALVETSPSRRDIPRKGLGETPTATHARAPISRRASPRRR